MSFKTNVVVLIVQYIIIAVKFMFVTEYKYEALKHINVLVTKHLSKDASIIDFLGYLFRTWLLPFCSFEQVVLKNKNAKYLWMTFAN